MTYRLEANIAREIADLCRVFSQDGITRIEMNMSLTRDLHFDSDALMQFFSHVEQLYAGLALEKWFIENNADGRDTVGSVVRYIADALPRAASEPPYGPQRPDRAPLSTGRPGGAPTGHGSLGHDGEVPGAPGPGTEDPEPPPRQSC